MTTITILLVLLVLVAAYTLYKRISAGFYTATDTMFSQAGVTVDFHKKIIQVKNRQFDLDKVTNIRTVPPLTPKRMAFDCVISIKDFKLPEHRITFISSDKANKFMQRLATAISQAGGPEFR